MKVPRSASSRLRRHAARLVLFVALAVSGNPSCATTSTLKVSVAPNETSRPQTPSSFERAKKLATELYADHALTLYCGCPYTPDKVVHAEPCGYEPRTPGIRGRRIEWEHVVPAFAFGGHRACWQPGACRDGRGRAYGGRRCCRKIDVEFRAMEADLHNLVPEVGELNADRSSYAFGEIEGEPRAYGACDFEVDRQARTAEPAPAVRGDIARAYLYMAKTYGARAFPLDIALLSQLERWHRADPPDGWELLRDQRISRIQGSGNPFVRAAHAAASPASRATEAAP